MTKKHIALAVLPILLISLIVFFKSAPPSPIYLIKISREYIQNFFIFGDEDKAFWVLTKAEKRISEAEILKSKNINYLANLQLESAKNYQKEADTLITSLKDKVNRNYLIDKFSQNEDRIKAF